MPPKATQQVIDITCTDQSTYFFTKNKLFLGSVVVMRHLKVFFGKI